MLNNLTNFFNLIRGRRIKTQLEPSDLIAVGTKQSSALGDYKPTAIGNGVTIPYTFTDDIIYNYPIEIRVYN